MGNGAIISSATNSQPKLTTELLNVAWAKWINLYYRIGLSRAEFDLIYSFFSSLHMGNRYDFAKFTDIEKCFAFQENIFLLKLFAIVDIHSDGFIDFAEFTVCIWNFCTHSPATLLFHSYSVPNSKSNSDNSNEGNGDASSSQNQESAQVIDNKSNGPFITKEEVMSIIWTLHWTDHEANDLHDAWPALEQEISRAFSTANKDSITFDEFDQYFPFASSLLSPVQRLRQSIFRKLRVSEGLWKTRCSQVVLNSKGKQSSIVQFKKLGNSAVRKLLEDFRTSAYPESDAASLQPINSNRTELHVSSKSTKSQQLICANDNNGIVEDTYSPVIIVQQGSCDSSLKAAGKPDDRRQGPHRDCSTNGLA